MEKAGYFLLHHFVPKNDATFSFFLLTTRPSCLSSHTLSLSFVPFLLVCLIFKEYIWTVRSESLAFLQSILLLQPFFAWFGPYRHRLVRLFAIEPPIYDR
jgi:hypothetical protein